MEFYAFYAFYAFHAFHAFYALGFLFLVIVSRHRNFEVAQRNTVTEWSTRLFFYMMARHGNKYSVTVTVTVGACLRLPLLQLCS
jgi:hypothetical protein